MKEIENIISNWNIKAAIFDLDGTLIDNNAYHFDSWIEYLKRMGRSITTDEYKANMNGRTNKDVAEYIYQRKLSDEEAMKYSLEKEAIYREIYQPHIKPVDGLIDLLELLYQKGIPMAIATSGIQVNIDFMFDNLPIRKYFKTVVSSAHITKGKPDPEIYLKSAEILNVTAGNCLAFEDAAVGVQSAKTAGMKVAAILTTQTKEELHLADLIINDFTELI